MKKVLSAVFMLLAAGSVFALDFFKFGDFIAGKDCILWEDYRNKISRENLYVGKDGWYHFNDRLIIFQSDGYERFTQATLFNFKYPEGKNNRLNYHAGGFSYSDPEIIDVPEVSFKASSSLSEALNGKKLVYSPDGLSDYMREIPEENSYAFEELESMGIWNYAHLPWCEGKDDYGIGEKITAKFAEPVYTFVILNGYVDPLHPDYYKKNSRVKKLKVTDTEHNKSYFFELEDTVIEQRFSLEQETESLVFEIADVYKGDKYKDTCITGLFGETDPAYFWVSDGEDSVKSNKVEALQNYLKYKFNDWLREDMKEVKAVSIDEDCGWKNYGQEYYIRSFDDTMLYLSIIDSNRKYNPDEKIDSVLYDDGTLKLILFESHYDLSYETKKTVKSVEYRITSSIPLLNDSRTVEIDQSDVTKTVPFKGFYYDGMNYYHFITGFYLKFNFSDGTTISYTASERDLKKIVQAYDLEAEHQWNK